MKKLATSLAAVTLTIGLAACGGSNGPEDAVNEFIAAVKDKDAAKTCDLLAPENKKQIEQLQQGSCEEVMKKGLEAPVPGVPLENSNATVKDSKVDGDNATVTVDANGQTSDIKLVKVDGDWKIDMFQSLGG